MCVGSCVDTCCHTSCVYRSQLSDELQQRGGPTDQLLYVCDRGRGPCPDKPKCVPGEAKHKIILNCTGKVLYGEKTEKKSDNY